ncbi:apolipoprotein N-acyltransferase [Allokutzneria albata]|uniref:Apolipoprotein N-acyltransferase n=1 Tax=Allokutzneria albata TaxID=211114 RepID=A0A1G9RNE7_ALLAB|nr:apolipoprotein N-acyltransferase [Allokutzneria albata]SDM24772.1 apolipoprotein N-acyltransferase [Allokutzneria albata]
MAAPAVTPEALADPAPARRYPRSVAVRSAGAVLAGGLLYASSPPRELWWLTPIAFALLAAVLWGRRARAGFGYGLLFGLAYLLPLLLWLEHFLGSGFGPWPWLTLSLVEAVLIAVATTGMAVVSTLPLAPVWMAAMYVSGDVLRSSFPLNGFPWGRAAFTQTEGPYLALASLGGSALVGFAVVLTGCALASLARARLPAIALVVLPLVAGLLTWPSVGVVAQNGMVTVALVQGNAPDAGLALMERIGEIRANHLARTRQLVEDIRENRVPRPDLVVWPETATDLGRSPAQDAELDEVLRSLGVPALIGARLTNADGSTSNVSVVWSPVTGRGAVYAKQELVPFSEYVPLRSAARFFTPFVDGFRDMTPGTGISFQQVGKVPLGVGICYEVAYDRVLAEATAAGAQLLVVPTNNAWFGRTEMTEQQLAMSRLRAVEHGRAVLVTATSGVSAVVMPDGSVTRRTELFDSDVLVAAVPLRSATTLATRLGGWPQGIVVAIAVAALLLGAASALRRRSAARAGANG